MSQIPSPKDLIGKDVQEVPMSLQRIVGSRHIGERRWIGPDNAAIISGNDREDYKLAQQIMIRLAIEAPLKHKSGHPGGPLSAFTFSYEVMLRRDRAADEPYRMSAGHLSLLAYNLQWLFGRDLDDPRLGSP